MPERVGWGAHHYRQRSEETSTRLWQLLAGYQGEGVTMSYTMEDFRRDFLKEHLGQLTPKERLAGLPPEEIRRHLSVEERLAGLSTEEILKHLSVEERLAGLTREEIEALLRRRPNGSSGPPG